MTQPDSTSDSGSLPMHGEDSTQSTTGAAEPPTTAPASPPDPGNLKNRVAELALDGKVIAILSIVGVLITLVLGHISSFVALFGSLLIAWALCAVSFRLKLAARFVVAALMLIALFHLASSPFVGRAYYDVGLMVVNSLSDPAERDFFWPDPEYMDIKGVVVVDTWSGLQSFTTDTDAGMAAAIRGIKSEMSGYVMRFAAGMFSLAALVLVCLGVGSRMVGLTSIPASATSPDLFRDLVPRDRISLAAVCIGAAAGFIGMYPQTFLSEIIEDFDYFVGLSPEAQSLHGLYWPMMVLDKVQALGFITAYVGALVILLGTPRRKLFEWFDQRALDPQAGRFDAPLKKIGLTLLVIGIHIFIIKEYVAQIFLIGSYFEISNVMWDSGFSWEFASYPGWLQIVLNILYVWVPFVVLGIVMFFAGSKTFRLIVRLIIALLLRFTPSGSGGGSTTTSSSGSSGSSQQSGSTVISGGAFQASQRAARGGGRGGGRGR